MATIANPRIAFVSASLMFPEVASEDTAKPTAPTGAPRSSSIAGAVSTVFASTGASLTPVRFTVCATVTDPSPPVPWLPVFLSFNTQFNVMPAVAKLPRLCPVNR